MTDSLCVRGNRRDSTLPPKHSANVSKISAAARRMLVVALGVVTQIYNSRRRIASDVVGYKWAGLFYYVISMSCKAGRKWYK